MAMSEKKRAEIAFQRRKQILNASLKLFDEKGFKDTTMQDIADVAGISKGLIYRYFQSKEDVLAGHAELITDCEDEIKNMPSATEALKLYAQRLLGDVNVTGYQPPLRVYFICYIQGYLSEDLKKLYFRSDHGKKYFGSIIKKGQDTGEFRQGDPAELGDIFWNYLLGCTSVLVCNRPEPTELPDIDRMIQLLLK